MTPLVELSPLGAARSRLGEPAAGLAFPEAFRAGVREYDLPEESVSLAWEIARLARNIAAEEGEALLVLALATLVAARQGSTRVPLPGAPADAGGRARRSAIAASAFRPATASGFPRSRAPRARERRSS